MRIVHPLWRGFWLAVALTAARALCGGIDPLAAGRGSREALVLFAAVAAGAFLASLPGRLRRRRNDARPTWRRCLAAFVCGALLALGMALAGGGRVLTSLMEGSTGAYGFFLAAGLSGLIAARLTGRRRTA